MKVLIAEDEYQKLRHLRAFVTDNITDPIILEARSVRSAIDQLEEERPHLVLLDMSLPTFDVAPGESGGRPQGFGGAEVMRYMDFLGIVAPVVVVTAYEGFEDKGKSVDLSLLEARLRDDHASTFRGIVYYSGLASDWQTPLKTLVTGILEWNEP